MKTKNLNNEFNKTQTAVTIAAVSTPAGISGIAVIRISGPQAASICDGLFKPLNSNFKQASDMKAYTVGVGYWYDANGEELIDKVVLTCFKEPHSYTGEDIYEVSCHGGQYIRQAILESLFDSGAKPAGPGEFSRRAFMNGKLDLVEAEAVMDMISAESSRQNQAAIQQLRGRLSEEISKIRSKLYQIMAQIEMIIEFPENEDSPQARENILKHLNEVSKVLKESIASFKQGRIVREGFRVVIAGKPNVGKSSLLNIIIGEEKAIVTSQPGTTRDIIEAQLIIDGLSVHITDTAGLRTTSDLVEKEGIDRAYKAIAEADLVFYVFSPEDKATWQSNLEEIQALTQEGKNVAIIAGKEDLPQHKELLSWLNSNLKAYEHIVFSKYDQAKIEPIKNFILQTFEDMGKAEGDAIMITHLRHRQIIVETAKHIDQARKAFAEDVPLDLIAGLLLAAAEQLAELTGDQVSEELVE
ncbi:MAG: tRNA uridine-5-carboxymethylaminomethyl(34) synthesis GTPase MnmE, partial [Clostridiaceae bacterium]|nr:tRNA uridine-5-carboxymethylaminomethyl(34) synthesis GTPase MnmE [Clostridiaceae bacterium]